MHLLVGRVNIKSYLQKMEYVENSHDEDVYLEARRYNILVSAFKSLGRVQNLVGHGNFNVLSFDEMLKYSRRYSSVGAFPELNRTFWNRYSVPTQNSMGFLEIR